MIDKPNPLAGVRDQTLALEYAPLVKKNLAILEDGAGDLEFPLVDIYVNDICNLRCEFCPTTFGTNNLPPEAIPLIARLKPRVITLTGGGEPSVYRHGESRIGDFISDIRKELGQIPLGMMTNGVALMPQEAVQELSWMRISLNASTPKSYAEVHKIDRFYHVLSHIAEYAKMKVEKVGIGFVYTPRTIGEIVEFARVIARHVLPHISAEERKKITLQFRPVADRNYERYAIAPEQQARLRTLMDELPPEAHSLLEQQSNILEVMRNQCFTLQGTFHSCYVSLLQMNIDAKGDAYPCPQKAHAFEDRYGNIFESDFFDRLKARIKDSVVTHTCKKCPTCSQAKINNAYTATDLTQVTFDRPVHPVFF